MEPIKVAESFVENFKVEDVHANFDDWQRNERQTIVDELERVKGRLSTGGLTRKTRTKNVERRKELESRLEDEDPRVFQVASFDSWAQSNNLVPDVKSIADWNAARTRIRGVLRRAVENVAEYETSGLPPFFVDFEGSGNTFKIKTVQDYFRHQMEDHGRKLGGSLQNKAAYAQKMLDITEQYSGVDAETKLMSQLYIDMALKMQEKMVRQTDILMIETAGTFRKQKENLDSLSKQVDQIEAPN